MLPQREEIINALIKRNILNAKKEIIDEGKFIELIFAIFLSLISHERVKFFWARDFLEEQTFKERHSKIMGYFHLPFHFVGFSNKTVFIADKHSKDKIFNEEFIPTLINSFEDIYHFRKVGNLNEITNQVIWSNHSCAKGDKEFCSNCKSAFSQELIRKSEPFFKTLNVKSYLILDIPISLIMEFVSEDDLIEETERNMCKTCNRLILPHFKFCPECGVEIERTEDKMSKNREKMFNELMCIFLSLKNKLDSGMCKSNLYLHKDTHETDIYLKNNKKSLLIEGTTQIDLPKEYIIKKAILLLVVDAISPQDMENYLIIWSLDKECACETNKEYTEEIFDKERFILLESSLERQILNNPTIGIDHEELSLLKKDFFSSVEKLNNEIKRILL